MTILSESLTPFAAMEKQLEAAVTAAFNNYCDYKRAQSAGDFCAQIRAIETCEYSYCRLARILGLNPARDYFAVQDAIETSSGALSCVIAIVNRLDGGWTTEGTN